MRRLGFWSTQRFQDSKFFRETVESFISKTCAFCWTKKRNRLMLAIANYSKICQIRRGMNKIDSTNPVKILQSPEGSHYWQIFSLSTFWQNICWHKIVIKLSLWSNFRFLRIKKKSFVNSRRLWFEDRHLWLCRPIAEARFEHGWASFHTLELCIPQSLFLAAF